MIDFNIDLGSPIKDRDIDLILQQIDILFDTIPGEVLGDTNFGSVYDRYLYNLQVSNIGISNQIMSDLGSLELFGFTPDVQVYFLEGSENDIIMIKIILTRDREIYEKIYKVTK